MKKGLPWERAKAFDGSAAVGRFVSKSTIQDVNNLTFSLTKNGDTVQEGNTNNMLFSIDQIIAFASQYFTLKIGDLIFTGTPEGVGPIHPNDILEGYLADETMFKINVK